MRSELKKTQFNHKKELDDKEALLKSQVGEQYNRMQGDITKLAGELAQSQRTIVELNAMLDKPRLGPDDVAKLREREKEFLNVYEKLTKAEESTEGAFTCFACMGLYRSPVTCVPCGHSFCTPCMETANHCTVWINF